MKIAFLTSIVVITWTLFVPTAMARVSVVTSNADIFVGVSGDEKFTKLLNLNDLLVGSELAKGGNFAVQEATFDYRSNTLYAIVRNRVFSGALAFDLVRRERPIFAPGVVRITLFDGAKTPILATRTEPFVVGDALEQQAYEKLRVERVGSSVQQLKDLTGWRTVGEIQPPQSNCFFGAKDGTPTPIMWSPVGDPDAVVEIHAPSLPKMSPPLQIRLGCWNASTVLFEETVFGYRANAETSVYLYKRDLATNKVVRIRKTLILDSGAEICQPGDIRARFAFCYSVRQPSTLVLRAYDFVLEQPSEVLFGTIDEKKSATTPYIVGSSADRTRWYVVVGHQLGLGEGFATSPHVLHLGAKPKLLPLRFEGVEGDRIRGIFELHDGIVRDQKK